MIQTRICSYYKCPCSHYASAPITFLNLPEELRDRIYCDAGLIAGATLRVTGRGLPDDLQRSNKASFYVTSPDTGPFSLPNLRNDDPGTIFPLYFNLSLSNRLVNGDVVRFFYSHNEVLICCKDYTHLSSLLEMPPALAKALRCLTVHLDLRPCHTRHCHEDWICCHILPDCRPNYSTYRRRPVSKNFHALITTWRKTISYLAKSADLSQLKLSVMCDVEDVAAAHLILEPFQGTKLAPDAVRFGKGIHEFALQDIAREAVLGADRIIRPFRFLELPTELRQSILSFTDLVTPVRTIWCQDGAQFKCAEDRRDHSVCSLREFCSIYGAAYPTCNCWRPPTAIFLVCKDMLENARAIFFTSNHFCVLPRSSRRREDEPFEASTFLRKTIPHEALRYLRNLKIIFPPVLYDFSGLDEGVYKQWLRTIDYVAPHLKTLALDVAFRDEESYPRNSLYPDIPWPDYDFFSKWQIELFRMHELILEPLSKIDCLNSFSIRAVSSTNRDKVNEQQLRDHEMHLQHLVMRRSHDNAAR